MSETKDEFLSTYKRDSINTVELPEVISAQYQVEACLKDSDAKQAYLLRAKGGAKLVLLKRAFQGFRSELENEYQILSSLNSANIPKAELFFEDERYAYLLREYVTGESLYSMVGRKGVFPENKAVDTAASICDCLSFLHNQKPPVIHRDVKPQNVIITPEGKPVLIDLGTARRFRPGAFLDTVFMGTHATAAPEQYGFAQTDARCDIFALGMLMIYMLTGEFLTDDTALQGISKPLRGIIDRCIEMDPRRRWADANALKAALRQIQKRKPCRFVSGFIIGLAVGICVSAITALFCFFLPGAPAILHTPGVSAALQGVNATATPGIGSPSAQATIPMPSPEETPAPSQEIATVSSQSVQFTSQLIEKAVRFELDKKDGEPILQEDLANVHQLAICGNVVIEELNKYDHYCDLYVLDGQTVNGHGSVDSLEDLRRLNNLKTLVLDRQNIHDLSPLEGLPLQTLELKSNQIVDLTPLKQCADLVSLSISANPVKDISPIASLKNLETLDISFTDVTDISDIAELPIRYLDMFEMPLRNYETLKQFTSLESLGVRYAPEEGIQVIGSLTRLKSLAVFCCNISNLDILAPLTNLQSLNLNSNRMSDLSDIGYFPKLQFLDVNNNPVQSLKPLTKLQLLHGLNIADSDISDLSVLLEMPGLRDVGCDRVQAEALNKLSTNLPFRLNLQ